MNLLYFAHSYQPAQRRFNERIWRELSGQGFYAWIDQGLERGAGGRRYPMDVSFNEWMMSRCDGFIAVVPTMRSPYLDLEHRLALRMGLPTLVVGAQGADFREGSPDGYFPQTWNTFLTSTTQNLIKEKVTQFAQRVRAAQSALVGRDPGHRRIRALGGGPSVAFLPPSGGERAWAVACQRVAAQHAAATLLVPMNYRRPWDLMADIDGRHDLLVVDVGPQGTPREMLGYLEAHAVPLVRVCQVPDARAEGPDHDPGERDAFRPVDTRPYVRRLEDGSETGVGERTERGPAVSMLTDGLQADPGMRPVLYWSDPTQLAQRVLDLIARINGYLRGFAGSEDPARIPLETHRHARDYFAPPQGAARVFLSFAGAADSEEARAQKRALSDQLVNIFRFHDLRCFHYLDEDASVEGRLESGEAIDQGLATRVEDSDVIVVLFDAAYSRSPYCIDELQQATELRERGLVRVRAYRLSGVAADLNAFQGINVFEHRGTWADADLQQRMVEDVLDDCRKLQTTLREAETRQVRSWLEVDGCRTGTQLRRLLMRCGLSEAELSNLGVPWDTDLTAVLDQLLRLPSDKPARRRRRAILVLLLSTLATGSDARRALVNRWVLQRSLGGRLPRSAVSFEQVVEVPNSLVAPHRDADPVETGIRLGQELPAVLKGANALVLLSDSRAAEVQVEWARENASTDAICLRRPVRWKLPHADHRDALVEDLSTRALPPRWLLLALAGEGIDPGAEVRQTAQALAEIYCEQDWPPEFVQAVVCDGEATLKGHLAGCGHEVVLLSGHMGSDSVQVGAAALSGDTLAQWLAESAVRLVVLNGCEGARPRSTLALHSVALADRLVQFGKVPEVVAMRRPLTDADSLAFAMRFGASFARSFDAVAACFDARKAGSDPLRYSPIVISQRKTRVA